ncbi:MAG: SDR family NAD(P)-dependent oxidoreductase [Rhodocyclaceae bacterium]|jgi:NAD(P)-dependent dehydrogenase (short-subunit alcohol dehydrogenase family)|nr:SDR family NAD(P)-dependent oxidoreductase [Rhodocyclaceae bacterium]
MGRRYEGKVVLVTGAGRGMGRAMADAFADEGATVVVSARTSRYGEAAVEAIRARGGRASLVTGDVSDSVAVREMFEHAVREHGRLDVVVHCAADNAHGLIAGMKDENYDYLIRSNIHSLFYIAKHSAPYLARAVDKGRLIYISSAMANRTFMPGLVAYGASKAYLNAFARGLALEFAPMNVLVNVIEPGMIASDRLKTTLSEEQVTAMSENIPVPRPGEPREIAAAALFLASTDASYITGSSLLVDGGVSMVSLRGLSGTLSKH